MKFFKSNFKPSIAICVPCRDHVHSKFTVSLCNLIMSTNSSAYSIKLHMLEGSLISGQRQKLAQIALEDGSTHIMWLDSDMIFPPNIIDILLSHNTQIVACTYSTRTEPYKSTAYKKIGNWDSWIDLNGKNEIEEVEGVGMGCMLVNSSVFKNLSLPWFEISYSTEYHDHIGEDFYFCTKARKAGFNIYIDISTSKLIKHLGTASYDSLQWPR